MKKLVVPGLLISCNAFASSEMQGRDDIIVYGIVIAVLLLLIGVDYFINFLKRLYVDPDYRYRLQSSLRDLLSLLREGTKRLEEPPAVAQTQP